MIPVLWKTSFLLPLPTSCPSSSKDYRTVALTSHIMKTLEGLVLEQFYPPGQASKPCEGHVFFYLSSIVNTFQPALLCEEAESDAGEYPCVLDCQLPDWQTTICAPATLCIRQSGQQHLGPPRYSPVSLPLHPLHH